MNNDLKKKKEKILQRRIESQKEYTFKPKTNESQNKEIIKMLLKG
jgi:hypothetical protein